MSKFIIVSILTLALVMMIAGCTTTNPGGVVSTTIPTPTPTAAVPVPTITIVSPANGSTVPTGSIPVMVSVTNFNIVDKQGQASVPGEGHVHFYLDVNPLPSDPSKPAIPASAQAIWAHVSGTSYTFTNVTPGVHTISVQLANNDHTPVIPLATASVTVTASGPVTTVPPTTVPMTTVPPTTLPRYSSSY